jgi:hypothetical protein
MKKYIVCILLSVFSLPLFAQEGSLGDLFSEEEAPKEKTPVIATFKTTRLINTQTIEQVKHGELDFRISHHFDDIAGKAGGIQTLYGFDNVTDIRLSFDYGITDNWVVGFARSKGAYQHRQILDFSSKYKLISQRKNGGFPLTISAYVIAGLTTMKSSEDIYAVTYFKDKFAHRMNYVAQLIIARKITSGISLELLPTYVHRNYVHHTDRNDLFALGIGGRIKFTKRMGVIFDYYYVFDKMRTAKNGYYNPLGIGLEIETGGHVFHILFSNNKGLIESQYLTENRSNWLKGEFRLGFNISRIFNIIKKKKNEK